MNNGQIDNTDYYRLPDGRYLEDFIHEHKLDFAWGSALKYAWRAGHKDGESAEKDLAKMRHYCGHIADRGDFGGNLTPESVEQTIKRYIGLAKEPK